MNSSPRGRSIEKAVSSPALAHLTMPELRLYRLNLTDEEESVSYWRRLVQARLDILDAASKSLTALTVEELIKALGTTAKGRRRDALLRVHANHPLPALPGLEALWAASVDPRDAVKTKEAITSLHDAEVSLTAYREVLHERLSDATSELISRYIEKPNAALTLIPEAGRVTAFDKE